MKLKRRALEVPSKIRSFIDSVIAAPVEEIEENLKIFVWQYDKGDCHHWVDLFNHFDTFFEKHIKSRKDLGFEDNLLECNSPFPRGEVLEILRVIRTILENCANKYFYSSCEPHLSVLLASTDPDVVEAALKTLAAVMKRAVGKFSVRDAALNSKLFAFAQGWGGNEEGLGLIACAVPNGCDPVAYDLGCTLHFEFYAMPDSPSQLPLKENPTQGLQIIHIPNVNSSRKPVIELFNNLVTEYSVPMSLRFLLLTRLRFAGAFHSLSSRQQYTCIRLYAFILLIQAYRDSSDLTSFFKNEPKFISELVSVLICEEFIPEKIRILSLHSLVALCNDRRHSVVLSAVTSGGHRDILSGLLQKAFVSVTNEASKSSVAFAEALLSLVTVLVSSSSCCSAMCESGFILTLLSFITISRDPQHLHLACSVLHVLEAFIDYSNPAAELFRDLGGLDSVISRLDIEISYSEMFTKEEHVDNFNHNRQSIITVPGSSADLDSSKPLYSEALVDSHRRLLIKALLHVISLGTYAPGSSSTRLYCSEESLLLHCLCIIFRKAQEFGGAVFSLAATVMNDLIQKDPTHFPVLEASGLPSAFIDAIVNGVVCFPEAITCIPLCLDALCLNNNGLQVVIDRNALKSFVKVFTSRTYSRALTSEIVGSLSSGLDELMRHVSSLRVLGVDMLIEILNSIYSLGSGTDTDIVPMKTDGEENNMVFSNATDLSMNGKAEVNVGMDVESFLPECVRNASRLLETILQNADTCRIFVEKKGIDAVLQLFNLPLMPLSVSIGQSIFVAFKLFSPLHSASLSVAVCLFLKQQLKLIKELLVSVKETQLSDLNGVMKTNVLRSLYSLEGIMSLSTCFLKGSASMVSELSGADAVALKDLGCVYKEVLWKISLICDSKVDGTKTGELDPESSDATTTYSSGREIDDDSDIAVERFLNPVSSIRSNPLPHWGGERDFLSVVRSGEGLHRRNGHSLSGLRRPSRHLEPLNFDYEGPTHTGESFKLRETKKKIPVDLLPQLFYRLASTFRSFFAAVIKGFTLPNRRRPESGTLILLSKILGTSLAKIFLEALSFSGSSDAPLQVKCQYLGKVVDDMSVLTFDSRRRTSYTMMINYFYVQGTFKELLTTFEATSQLLWSLPCSISLSNGIELEKNGEGNKLSHNSWLIDTVQSYCRVLEYFVNSSLLLSSTSASQAQLLVQPVSVGLSIGLFPVPREPEIFVRMMQSQVLDVILPVWNHSMFPNCNLCFINSIVSLVTYIYSGIGDVKRTRAGLSGSSNPRFAASPPPDETTISTIVEMGFTRARAEEALRRVERNSVEMAMEWLFSHAENPVQEDDELAQALALSLGNSSESSKGDSTEKAIDVVTVDDQTKVRPVDEILTASLKLFQIATLAFPLADLLMTLCNRCSGEDRPEVTCFLVQQLKLCPQQLARDTSALGVVSHVLALLLLEDGSAQEIAVKNGIVPTAIDIVMNFKTRNESGVDVLVPKYISALLLILDKLLQSELDQISESANDVPDSAAKDFNGCENESCSVYHNILGRLTGYVTMKESQRILLIACDLIKQHVPSIIMHVLLQLCARLTKNHALALQFLENGGMVAVFNLPWSSLFPGYDTLVSAITRHLIEDPQTLQTSMELEIRQIMAGSRHGGRISPRTFLTSMAPVIARNPCIFMKTTAVVCMLESFGGRTMVALSKEKLKEKDKAKELGSSYNGGLCISENKGHEGSGKISKSHKKNPANLTEVMDCLFEIVLKYPSTKSRYDCIDYSADDPSIKKKGKSKADDTNNAEFGSLSERCADLARVTFVLKLLSDILQKYVHVVGLVLKRDSEFGSCGIFYHVLHRLLPLSMDKTAGSDEWQEKLSQKSSWFLVVVCGRSPDGRKRVIHELVKSLTSFSNLESSTGDILLPDNKIFAFVDLVHSILWKNIFPGSSISLDAAKSMIDGGMVNCLTSILQVFDLDHPDAPKTVNIILRILESLTRVANASEHVLKFDGSNKKKVAGSSEREHIQNENYEQEHVNLEETTQTLSQEISRSARDHVHEGQNQNLDVEMEDAVEANPPMEISMDFMREEMDDDVLLNNRGDDYMGDDDDDMGDDDDDDDEGGDDDEDEDVAEDGAALMSLVDTDVEDHDDEYHDEMNGDDDDGYHENRVIEVRWRETLDGLDRLPDGIEQPDASNGIFNVPHRNEPFDGMDFEPPQDLDDLFGLRRTLGFDQCRHSDTPVSRTRCFQHPLLVRPSQSGELTTGNSTRDLESTTGGNLCSHDQTIIRHNQASSSVLGGRLGGAAAPPSGMDLMNDYYALMDPVNLSRQRGTSDGWWTDDGQPQGASLAASIAQAVEEQFLCQLRTSMNSLERQTLNTGNQEKQQSDDHPSGAGQPIEGDHIEDGSVELLQTNEVVPTLPALPSEIHNGGETLGDALEVNTIANEDMYMDPGFVTTSTEFHGEDVPIIQSEQHTPPSNSGTVRSPSIQNVLIPEFDDQANERGINNVAPGATRSIDPTFLEALPVDLRVEVLASQRVQPVQAPSYSPPPAEEIDPEFLAALPPDIQAEVLAQQRAQRVAQEADGQPVDMDNASIIATFPSDLREEVLLTSSEAVLSALPSPLLAEAQMLRDRALSHYQARSLFGSTHTLSNQRNGLGFDRQNLSDRGVRITRRVPSILNNKEVDGEPLVDSNALKALIRILRIAQPLNKGLLEKLFLNLCAHTVTRGMLVHFFLDMIKPAAEGVVTKTAEVNSQRLYGCQSHGVYGRQLSNGLPPLVLRRVLEVLAYLARNHATVATILFCFGTFPSPALLSPKSSEIRLEKGKDKMIEDAASSKSLGNTQNGDVPFVLFLKLLNQPLFLRSISHLEEVMDLLRVIVQTAASKLEHQPELESGRDDMQKSSHNEVLGIAQNGSNKLELGLNLQDKNGSSSLLNSDGKRNTSHIYNVFLNLPRSDLRILCSLLGREGLSDKVYKLAGEVLMKLASVARTLRIFFTSELSELAHGLSSSAISELSTLMDTHMLGLSTGSMTGDTILRVFKLLSQLSSPSVDDTKTTEESCGEPEEDAIVQRLNVALEPLWKQLSICISSTETQLSNSNIEDNTPSGSTMSPPLPPGTHKLLPFIEAFFVLCEKLQANLFIAQEHASETAKEVKEFGCQSPEIKEFGRFPEKHRRLLNAFIRQNPGLLEKSFSMMLKAPKLIDFDNKRTNFRSRIKLHHEQHLSVPLRICVRRAYVLEDSYNQMRIRSNSDLKGRLNVHFQGEEGIDAGGLTREWYQLLSRVIFDKGALLFTTVGNDASFQPNPNSVYQTEHLSYFKFIGRVVGKALFDGQLLDVHFTRSFYKHILGVKVTYHDIEAVDPDYYKNLKWMLENNMSDIPDLTFSMDADEEKHILYEKAEVTDYELKPGGRNIRVTEETKHEYVDLVADHILTNAIRPQTNSFLEGFSELIPPELISIFNDKELELLISGLPEIDLDDLKANTEYSGYSVLSRVVQWFWEIVKAFNKEDMARLLQFVTGTSKVPLDGFKALQGISGTQRFQIHKAYGAPERLPSAHTCFNQLDLPEYSFKEQLEERLLLAIHEGSEGFGFG